METTRNCKHCGKLLERRRVKGKLEGTRDFRRRNFCDKKCSSKYQHSNKENVPVLVKDAVELADNGDSEQRKTAFQFLEDVINGSHGADITTKVTAAKALLPYQEKKVGETGKKTDKEDAAKKASTGRFAPALGPKVVNIKG